MRSPTKRKILLLLAAGVTLGLSRSPRRHGYILRATVRAWKEIEKEYLYRTIKEFKQERLVSYHEKQDGTVKIILSEAGKQRALVAKLNNLQIKKPIRWDGKWRIIFSDVPEKKRHIRDALRNKFRELGFLEIQKSTFVYPFPCRDEIDFIVECLDARNFVIFGELQNPTNQAALKLHFKLY